MKKALVYLIDFYQKYLSFDRGIFAILVPGGACKYEISCSEYTKRMVLEYGVFKGIILGIRRIISCW